MKDSKIIALAKECGANDYGIPDTYVTVKLNGHFVMTPDELLAFAKAVADLQKEKDAQICEQAEDAMHRIKQWCDAYPMDIFPEPDFKRAAEVLKAAGMTIDAISASNMRHVLKGVSEIAGSAIRSPESDIDEATMKS